MTPGKRLKALAADLAAFTVRERRGILWFIPIIIVISLVAGALSRPRFERSLQLVADGADPAQAYYSGEGRAETRRGDGSGYGRGGGNAAGAGGAADAGGRAAGEQSSPRRLFTFDPNTIDYRGLRALGFSSRAAAGILKYRASGKVFRIPEEFAACWDVGDSLFYVLEPYIVIGPQFAVKKSGTPGTATPAPAADTTMTGAGAGVTTAAASPWPTRQVRIVELNSADSATLTSVSGIGELTAGRIAAYRARLGGFVRAEQLAEVKGMTEGNYERILQQISIDPALIQKIDINFATLEKLSGHPYISSVMLRKVVKNRQLKGGWSTTDDMIQDGTLTAAEAVRIGPYLQFTTHPNR